MLLIIDFTKPKKNQKHMLLVVGFIKSLNRRADIWDLLLDSRKISTNVFWSLHIFLTLFGRNNENIEFCWQLNQP